MTGNRDAPCATVAIRQLGDAAAAAADLGDRLLSFSYEDNAKLADEVALTLDNYDCAMFDDPRFRLHNELEVAFGYHGDLSTPRRCVIVELGGGLVRTVRAIGQATWMDRETKSRRWIHCTRSDVVRKIAGEHGFGADAHIEDTKVVYPQITQARCTDAELVASLAHREGFEFFIRRGELHFHRARLDQQPVATLVWTGQGFGEDPDCAFVELPSFSEEIHGKVGKMAAKGTDPVTKKPIAAARSNADHQEATLGTTIEAFDQRTGQSLGLVAEAAVEHTSPTSAPTEAAAKREADARYRQSRHKAIKMKCAIVGNKDIGAHDLIEVAGVGQRLSGKWYVVKAVHKPIGAGPYTTDLECTRDAHYGYADGKRDVKAKGALNTKDAVAPEALEPVDLVDPRTGESIGTSYRPRH